MHNPLVKEEIKRKIREYFELDKNEIIYTYKTRGVQSKLFLKGNL